MFFSPIFLAIALTGEVLGTCDDTATNCDDTATNCDDTATDCDDTATNCDDTAFNCPCPDEINRSDLRKGWNRTVFHCNNANINDTDKFTRYPGILSNYDYRQMTPDSIFIKRVLLITLMKNVYDDVGKVAREEITFKNVIQPLIDLDGEYHTQSNALTFARQVAMDKTVRDASADASKKISELGIDLSLRKDVYENIKAFNKTEEAKSLNYEQKRYLDVALRDGKRDGLLLSGDELEEFKKKKKKVSEIEIDFRKCLDEDSSHFYAEEKDLEGVPQDVIKSMEKDESGKYKVTTKGPHYGPVIKYCKNPRTRYIMESTYQSRCMEENTPRVEEMIALRQRNAELLGYPNHAAFVQEIRMAKNPETVEKFLNDLITKLQILWKREKESWLKLKKIEAEELGFEFNGKIAMEDILYYRTQSEKKEYSVDKSKLKEYFPLETVIKGMLEIYQRLLGLNFKKLENGEVWHDDVIMYQVNDKATKEHIGYFYMDLHPREGKRIGAAQYYLQPGSLDRFGYRQKAISAMVTNFPKPSGDNPALLEHSDVKTMFHEFGHIMHGICSRTNISTFAGPRTERDFVETPSTMLENWVWEEESLKMMSGHYKDGSPIPLDLLKNLVASKASNSGASNLRRIFYATLDLKLHTTGEVDIMQLAKNLYKDLLGMELINGTNMAAPFRHLVGYSAGYYGYMWSNVFSQDMFDTRFRKEGILNPETGMDYRLKILRPGGSIDAAEMLRNFLGREPNQNAFLQSIGQACTLGS